MTELQLFSEENKLGKLGTINNIIKAPKIIEMCKTIVLELNASIEQL